MLNAASRDRIARALPGWKVQFADDADSWNDEIFDRRLGFEMWRTLLMILLALLVVEGIAAATGRVRTQAVSAQET